MAISIDWATYTINVPRADMLLLQSNPIEVRQLDLTTFHETLRDLEDDPAGIPQPVTHNYRAALEISGVILAQVIEVLEPYTVTFEDGQYAVNIVGGNSNVADRVNINNVGVRTSNSAGLQDLSSLQAASYTGGSVAINVNSSYAGQLFPVGTRGYPVNNLHDAHEIAESRGISTFAIMASMTLATESLADGYTFHGDNPAVVTLTLDPSSDTTNAEFRHLTIQGTFDGNNVFRDCHIIDAFYVTGFIHNCALTGSITLAPNSALGLLDCYSNVPGGGSPVIDFDNSVNADLAVRNWAGGLAFENLSSATSDISVDMASGRLFIRSNCTGGTVIVRGVGEVIDEAGGAVTIIDETVNTAIDAVPTNVWNFTQ